MDPSMARPEPLSDLDWDAERARRFAQRTVELWSEWLDKLPSLPVAPRVTPEEVRAALTVEVPDGPMGDDELFAYLRRMVFDWSMYPGHPRFMAYVSGAGTVPGAAAELLAAGLNMNLGGYQLSPSATEIEVHLMRWFASQFGMNGSNAGGLLVSGGALATFVGLKAARDHRLGLEVRHRGIAGAGPGAMYATREVHVVTHRAADMLGLGSDAVRTVEVDGDQRMRPDHLAAAIEADVANGVRPIAAVASAGTVSTGAIDPLDEIADVCAEHGVWLHVDGAYGGPAVFADDLRPLLAGIGRADSIAFDPHKWLYIPHSAGAVLVQDMGLLVESFSAEASYTYSDEERSPQSTGLRMFGPQFSRGFQALKVWVSLLSHGRGAYADRISHDAALARYLGERAAARQDFELLAPVGLSICCFRYLPQGLAGEGTVEREEYLNRLNQRLMTEMQLDGRVFLSNVVIEPSGAFGLRVCVVNFRTEAEDMDAVLDVAAELGSRLDAELRPASLRHDR
jgi:glutamate/tyrosine decarboxylase-like PLP-dependent enzyme